jgi:hypothetical protein
MDTRIIEAEEGENQEQTKQPKKDVVVKVEPLGVKGDKWPR